MGDNDTQHKDTQYNKIQHNDTCVFVALGMKLSMTLSIATI